METISSTIDFNSIDIGRSMHRLVSDLYPICRSITGEGVRSTLRILQQKIPLDIVEVPTGTPVFDWTVPREWNIRDAYVANNKGERVVDFRNSTLHIVNYSVPVRAKMSLSDLKPHLFTLPEYPNWIPYRTSYYKETWGFCMAHKDFLRMDDGEYEVVIDSSLEAGFLTYGEYYLEGQSADEILISCHVCHPSLCNDNLSGIALASHLAQSFMNRPRRYSYRFLFVPGTIGSISWLYKNQASLTHIKHGLVLVDVGDAGRFTYKKSRRGNAEIDRAVINILKHSSKEFDVRDFDPYGHDERQYCSPGVNLAVGCFSRSPHGEFPEYHTSADNIDFVQPEQLGESFEQCYAVLELLEHNKKFLNLNPMCEPQLGKRGLYGVMGGAKDGGIAELPILWVLNLSDGEHSLLDISERSGLSFTVIKNAANALVQGGLLKPLDQQ